MIKKYCDICDNEMPNDNSPNLGRDGAVLCVPVAYGITLEIKACSSYNNNKHDICKHCALNAIYESDNRINLEMLEVIKSPKDSGVDNHTQHII